MVNLSSVMIELNEAYCVYTVRKATEWVPPALPNG